MAISAGARVNSLAGGRLSLTNASLKVIDVSAIDRKMRAGLTLRTRSVLAVLVMDSHCSLCLADGSYE
jgi:hypothetical protein